MDGSSVERTAFLLHPASALHDTGWGHPEHQGRLRALASTVGADILALHGWVRQVQPDHPVAQSELLLAHSPEHVRAITSAVARAERDGRIVAMDGDTVVSSASWEAATGSVSAAVSAASLVSQGAFENAFVATRPPGHHATRDRVMGFCLLNSVAVTSRWLQRETMADRILVVDWDVHHGNGTQEIFWEDDSVFFLSLHQFPHWPGSGAADEVGGGQGRGFTRNVPLPPGTPREAYLASYEDALETVFAAFQPDFVLISAGFDVLAGDPLGGQLLEPEDLHEMTRLVMSHAHACCEGRVVALLEGGYDVRRTAEGAVSVIRALAGVQEAR